MKERLPIIVAMISLAVSGPTEAGTQPDSDRTSTASAQVEPTRDKEWHMRFKDRARNALANVEETADVAWAAFERRLGLGEPRHIAAYAGYGNADRVWISGRVLAGKPMGGPAEDDNWFDNLKSTYQRWNSKEVPGVSVSLIYGDETRQVTTDREGYYHADFARKGTGTRDSVLAHLRREDGGMVAAMHPVHITTDRSQLMIISDMDDTVIHTGITDLLVAAQLTFLNNARTRKPLAGVGSLYRALTAGPSGKARNPVFYVSNSAWNMYDLLYDFLQLNDLPSGPLMLRDIGLEPVGEGSEDHKIQTIRRLLDRHDLPAILVGDSGQHDAEIYRTVAKEYAGRILAIYVRDIDPDAPSAYDDKVDAIIREAEGVVPFLRVADSSLIAGHAFDLGLLSAGQVEEVAADTGIDKRRDTLAEKALAQTVAVEGD